MAKNKAKQIFQVLLCIPPSFLISLVRLGCSHGAHSSLGTMCRIMGVTSGLRRLKLVYLSHNPRPHPHFPCCSNPGDHMVSRPQLKME